MDLLGSFGNEEFYRCQIGIKLDGSDEASFECGRLQSGQEQHQSNCNGQASFCGLRFDQFLFAGSHNSGTGESDSRMMECAFKNHDLDITEQLDFGMRMFDFDIVYSEGSAPPFCNGLETGHGRFPWVYQCFGQLGTIFNKARTWLEAHKNDCIVLYFGEVENEQETFPRLVKLLKKTFGSLLSDAYKKTGEWPTLGEAVASGRRVFVFVRSDIEEDSHEIVREVQVSFGNQTPRVPEGSVSILSTFKSA